MTLLKGKPGVAKTWYRRNASHGCGRRQAGRLYHFHDSLNFFQAFWTGHRYGAPACMWTCNSRGPWVVMSSAR